MPNPPKKTKNTIIFRKTFVMLLNQIIISTSSRKYYQKDKLVRLHKLSFKTYREIID